MSRHSGNGCNGGGVPYDDGWRGDDMTDSGADKDLENDMGDTPANMADMMGSADVKGLF